MSLAKSILFLWCNIDMQYDILSMYCFVSWYVHNPIFLIVVLHSVACTEMLYVLQPGHIVMIV